LSNSFQFKQFSVFQQHSAFKVGTDSVLLGAWVEVSSAKKILDIGTGTGLLALMLAQRNPDAIIYGMEPDFQSYEDATLNFAHSPWQERLGFFTNSIEDFNPSHRFDYFICNPPFFADSLLSPDLRKSAARHLKQGWLRLLAEKITLWADEKAAAGVILPVKEFYLLHETFFRLGWHLKRYRRVIPFPGGHKIRIMGEWTPDSATTHEEPELFIRDAERNYTEEYKALTSPFYLHF
jgi:tRNA1Val (adenine37-N6)-methyltransferase